MKLPNGVYDVLKYVAQVGLPALATMVMSLGAVWGWDLTDQVVKSIVAVNVGLGALLVLNQVGYNRSDAKYDAVLDPSSGVDAHVLREMNVEPTKSQALIKIL